MIRRIGKTAFAVGTLLLYGQFAGAENWPQWRGPRGDGTSLQTNVLVRWSHKENVLWKVDVPGEGHSSPIVSEKSAFVTSADKAGQRLLLRIDVDSGAVSWSRTALAAEREEMHSENSSASSTPATDGEYVYTSFQGGDKVDIRCFDFSGKQIWAAQPLKFSGQHGYSYSPILYRDLLILDCRQEGEAATIALDKRTGKERWRNKPARERISHVTPPIMNDSGADQLIVSGSDETRSLNPLTGTEIWRCKGPNDVAVAGLSYGDGLVFATAGYPARTRVAIRVDGHGDVTQTHVAWKDHRQVTYVPSPVFYHGHLYTVVDDGLLYCFDAKTGRAVWEQRVGGHFRSSLVLAAENIYATNDKGSTTVFQANPKQYRPLATNDLKEFCYATPAISNARLYLRTGSRLWCIGNR